MKTDMKRTVLELLAGHRILSVGTNRADGWPQVTIVNYANDDLVLYFTIDRHGQKYTNLRRDPRVSIAIGRDAPQPLGIRALSMAAETVIVEDPGEGDRAHALLLARHPEYRVLPRPKPQEVAVIRATPTIISIVDYAKGFGHADLVRVTEADLAESFETRRHHWAGHPIA